MRKSEQVTYELTPNAQIWPRALNSILGGDDEKIYLVAADLGRPSGSGLDFMCKRFFFWVWKIDIVLNLFRQVDSRFYSAFILFMIPPIVVLGLLILGLQMLSAIRGFTIPLLWSVTSVQRE
jgi:hypothetical protein